MSSACLEIAERTAISRARSPFLLDSIFEILIKFFHVNTQPLRERDGDFCSSLLSCCRGVVGFLFRRERDWEWRMAGQGGLYTVGTAAG
jgi:hypothetical protein